MNVSNSAVRQRIALVRPTSFIAGVLMASTMLEKRTAITMVTASVTIRVKRFNSVRIQRPDLDVTQELVDMLLLRPRYSSSVDGAPLNRLK